MSAYTVSNDPTYDIGTRVARLIYNKSLPQQVQQTDVNGNPVKDANGNPVMIANPALLAADADYVQLAHAAAAKSWYDNLKPYFRIPSGDWLQRWTDAERKQARAIGAGKVASVSAANAAQVQAWLDQLDASPFVNLGDAVVTGGTPQVCALLEATGTIAAGQGAARAAAITAIIV